jgi:NAD-dependent dihydropyrimidine dehydrogenase PreA subunit
MAYVVTDKCTKDFRCIDDCPTEAIGPREGDPAAERVSQVYINANDCADCGSCAATCSQGAIYLEDELPDDKKHFAELNRAYYSS